MPWKNGDDTTREILHVEDTGAEDVGVPVPSLGQARVARDGPYAQLDGMIGILRIIDGAGAGGRLGASRRGSAPAGPVRRRRSDDGASAGWPGIAILSGVRPRHLRRSGRRLRELLSRVLKAASHRTLAVQVVDNRVRVGPHHRCTAERCRSDRIRRRSNWAGGGLARNAPPGTSGVARTSIARGLKQACLANLQASTWRIAHGSVSSPGGGPPKSRWGSRAMRRLYRGETVPE